MLGLGTSEVQFVRLSRATDYFLDLATDPATVYAQLRSCGET